MLKRIRILGPERETFLAHVRNLPSQGFLLLFTLISTHNLGYRVTGERIAETLICFGFLVAFLVALYANVTIFIGKVAAPVRKWWRRCNLAGRRRVSYGLRDHIRLRAAMIRRKWVELLEVAACFIFSELGLAALLVVNLNTAVAFVEARAHRQPCFQSQCSPSVSSAQRTQLPSRSTSASPQGR